MDSHLAIPAPEERPKLDQWMRQRRLTPAHVSRAIRVSRQAIGNYCRPFSDSRRRIPHPDILERIVQYTGGDIRPADFYPPHLSEDREPGSEPPAAEARQ